MVSNPVNQAWANLPNYMGSDNPSYLSVPWQPEKDLPRGPSAAEPWQLMFE